MRKEVYLTEWPQVETVMAVPQPVFLVGQKLKRKETNLDRLIDIAEEKDWEEVEVICRGNMIKQMVRSNGWIVMRIEEFRRILPPEATNRVKHLREQGVQIDGLLIADDARHADYQQVYYDPWLIGVVSDGVESFWVKLFEWYD